VVDRIFFLNFFQHAHREKCILLTLVCDRSEAARVFPKLDLQKKKTHTKSEMGGGEVLVVNCVCAISDQVIVVDSFEQEVPHTFVL